jgi:hypothetical protein
VAKRRESAEANFIFNCQTVSGEESKVKDRSEKFQECKRE